MTAESSAQAGAAFRKSWRYRVGLALIIIGHAVLLCAMALPMLEFGIGLAGTLVVVGEGTCVLSIVFLGKDGFLEIKQRIVRTAREGFVTPVGRARFRAGIALLALSTVALFVVEMLALQHVLRATPHGAAPTVLGIAPAALGRLVLYLIVSGELAFIAAIYVLGADWWDRLRALFVWRNPAETRVTGPQ